MCRPVPTLLLCAALAAVEADPTGLGTADVELLDERAWVSAVSRRRQAVASAPAPVEVVLYEDLASSPAATIPDRLRYVPGVDVYQLRHGQYEVGIRGYNGPANNRILVLQDDWQFRVSELGCPIWTGSIDLSDLDRIEIAKGPASVTYGANAFGGVIAISSRPVGDTPTFTVVGRASHPWALEGDATAAMPLSHGFYAKFTAGITRLWDLPGVESPVQPRATEVNQPDTAIDTHAWRARGVLGLRLGEGWTAEVTARTMHRDPWEIADGMAYAPPNLSVHDDMLTLELRGPWLRLQHAERRGEDTYFNLKPDPDSYLTMPFLYLRYGFRTTERTTRAMADFAAGDHHLSLGGETTSWEGTSNLWSSSASFTDQSSWATVSTRDWGVFAEDQWSLGGGVQLSAGMRMDAIADDRMRASPRVALNWLPGPRSMVLLSYSGGYRPPTYLERFQQDTFVTPSEDLQPETIHALETQWRFRDGRNVEVSVGGFANRSNDLIWRLPLPPAQQQHNFTEWAMGRSPAPGPQYELANLDNPTTVLGLEVGSRVALGPDLALWGNATVQRYRMEDAVRFAAPGFVLGGQTYYQYDYTVPRDANGPPPWKLNAGLEWTRGHWFASTAGRLAGGRTAYDIGLTRLLQNSDPALEHIPSYAVLDLGLGWRSDPSGRTSVRLSVMDVFDSGHNESIRTTTENLQLSNETQYTSDLGRMVSVVVAAEF